MAAPSGGTSSASEPSPHRFDRGWQSRIRRSRRGSSRHRHNGAVYWSFAGGLREGALDARVRDPAQTDVGLCPLELIAEPLEDRGDDVVLAILVAARTHTDCNYGVDLL